MTRDVILRRVIHLDVRIQLGVLTESATHVTTTDLWNAEDKTSVHQRLPPYCRHRTCHRSTNQLADAQLLIPMSPDARSINMAVSAAMALTEALRQTKLFPKIKK